MARSRLVVMKKKRSRLPRRKAITQVVNQQLMRKSESLWYLNSLAAVNMTNTGGITGCLRPGQGAAYNQRKGSVVEPVYLEVRGAIEQNNASVQRQSTRIMVVQARKGDPAPGVADFPGFLGNSTPDQLAKYKVLYDKVFTLNENGAAAPIRKQFNFRLYSKHFHKARWLSSTTTAVSPDDGGAITLYHCSDVAASPPTLTMNSLCKYKDA